MVREPCCPDRLPELLGSPELARAWAALPRRRLERGERLFSEGERLTQVWRIERGLLRLFYATAQGRERNRSFHTAGQWVGAGVALPGVVSGFGGEALEPSVVVELSLSRLHELAAVDARVNAEIVATLECVVAESSRRESTLLLDAQARYLAFQRASPQLAERVRLRHVASHLGITDVALSRIRRRLGQTKRP